MAPSVLGKRFTVPRHQPCARLAAALGDGGIITALRDGWQIAEAHRRSLKKGGPPVILAHSPRVAERAAYLRFLSFALPKPYAVTLQSGAICRVHTREEGALVRFLDAAASGGPQDPTAYNRYESTRRQLERGAERALLAQARNRRGFRQRFGAFRRADRQRPPSQRFFPEEEEPNSTPVGRPPRLVPWSVPTSFGTEWVPPEQALPPTDIKALVSAGLLVVQAWRGAAPARELHAHTQLCWPDAPREVLTAAEHAHVRSDYEVLSLLVRAGREEADEGRPLDVVLEDIHRRWSRALKERA